MSNTTRPAANTTTTPAPAKSPSVATMRAAIKRAGQPVPETPKAIKDAYAAIKATPTAPKAPAAAKPTPAPKATPVPAPRTPANCACGCGAPTITAKALFVSGHDARLAGVLGRALSANPKDADALKRAEALSPKLQAKVANVKATADRKVAEKAARAKAKAAAAAAYAAALA